MYFFILIFITVPLAYLLIEYLLLKISNWIMGFILALLDDYEEIEEDDIDE